MSEIATYLGNKGYTIYKKNLEIEEQELIRKELVKRGAWENLKKK